MSLEGIYLSLLLLFNPCVMEGDLSKYASMTEAAVNHYWNIEDKHNWCTLLTIFDVESKGNPQAVSRAGAKGLAQFMDRTWEHDVKEEVSKVLKIKNPSPFHANSAIHGAAYYTSWLLQQIPDARALGCQWQIMEAAYNAGLGNIQKAKRLAQEAGYQGICWKDVQMFLHKVTGKRKAAETCRYVWKIARREYEFRGEDPDKYIKGTGKCLVELEYREQR